MGCDIHVHTEVKINGQWHHYGAPYVPRMYSVFAKMAGVRNDKGEVPIREPRGVPDALSLVTQMVYDREKGWTHSASWFDRDDIEKFSKWWDSTMKYRSNSYDPVERTFDYLEGNAWYDDLSDRGIEDVRWVFWFDN